MATPPDLSKIADQAMLERGFLIDFAPDVLQEVAALQGPAKPGAGVRDMRDRLFFSIDNDDSLDLDQLTFAEPATAGKAKIYVAVADVDALIGKGMATDAQAEKNTTSVYTPTKVFPMLPTRLSTDLTSLASGADRMALVVEMDVDEAGRSGLVDIYAGWVHNHAKLTYNAVAAFLERGEPLAPPFMAIEGLTAQLKLQEQLMKLLKEERYRQGSLSFGVIETEAKVIHGELVAIEATTQNRAQRLIEYFMIAANVAVTRYLEAKQIPFLKRVVRDPERWDRIVQLAKKYRVTLPSKPDVKALRDFLQAQQRADPLRYPDLSLAVIKLIGRGEYAANFPGAPAPGHFDLALSDYAHTTAPNRRYPDLIMQRLLKSQLSGSPLLYTADELIALAAHCTMKEDDATKVERRINKSAVAIVLEKQIGQQFDAVATGASAKGTWVRIFTPPVEGKLVKGYQGVNVGDRLTVTLIGTDIPKGFIDFAKVT